MSLESSITEVILGYFRLSLEVLYTLYSFLYKDLFCQGVRCRQANQSVALAICASDHFFNVRVAGWAYFLVFPKSFGRRHRAR